jgi:CRP/FNR family transcriptional regulator
MAGLERQAVERLAEVAHRITLTAGEMVFAQGDPATAFYLLVRGEVKVYKTTGQGRTVTLRLVHPGDMFAESALSAERYPADTECTAPSVLYRFAVDEFRALLLREPELAVAMLARTAELLSLLNRRVEELLLPVPARLARFVLELCDRQLRRAGSPHAPRICRLPMTKRDLAARLGTVPETLSRSFAVLKRTGAVRLSGNGELIEVLDFEELSRIAQH